MVALLHSQGEVFVTANSPCFFVQTEKNCILQRMLSQGLAWNCDEEGALRNPPAVLPVMVEFESIPGSQGGRVFATTHWSVVMAAGQGDSAPTEEGLAQAKNALETLCRGYWYPIYVYVRRKGYNPDDAADLTQEFFAKLISKDQLRLADRKKGKFRTFLLAMLDYFLAREWNRAHRQKRGGHFTFISLDQQRPEDRYRLEPKDDDTPEKRFEKQWALAVLKQAMERLERECEGDGKTALFGEVKNLLSGEREVAIYGQIGERLKMSEGAVRVAVHRLRQRYGELVRSEIAQTVAEPREIDEELQYLMRVLSG